MYGYGKLTSEEIKQALMVSPRITHVIIIAYLLFHSVSVRLLVKERTPPDGMGREWNGNAIFHSAVHVLARQ